MKWMTFQVILYSILNIFHNLLKIPVIDDWYFCVYKENARYT